MSLQEDEIFERWALYLKKEEEYKPEPANHEVPLYKPLAVNAGPRSITIDEYKKRQQKPTVQTKVIKKKKRAGKQYQKRKELAILYRNLNLATEKASQGKIRAEIRSFKINNIK